MKEIYITLIRTLGGLASSFLLAAFFVGADTLVPHKYVIVKDGKKIYANKLPEEEPSENTEEA